MSLVPKHIKNLMPYKAGKPISEVKRELNLKHIVKLASNENPMGPSIKAINHVNKYLKDTHRYPDSNGYDLRLKLAKSFNLDIKNVIIGGGSEGIMSVIMRTFLSADDEIIATKNSFIGFKVLANASGFKVNWVPMQNYHYDLDAMALEINEKTKVIYLANPDNPTGTYFNKSNFEKFMKSVPNRAIVLLDEAYFEYAKTEEKYPDCSQWVNDFDNLIVTRTFSKAYGLAALRIGYSLSHPDIANLLNRVRQPFNNNSLALIAAEVALQDTQYIRKSIELNSDEMNKLIQAFDNMGLEYIPSKANFICVDFKQPSLEIYQNLLKAGVIVRPISDYGMPNHLRISIGLEHENEKFINELDKIIAK